MKMRKFSEEGRLNEDVILSIMQEEKPNQVEQFKLPKEKINRFFAPGTPAQKIESDIVKGLELLRQGHKIYKLFHYTDWDHTVFTSVFPTR